MHLRLVLTRGINEYPEPGKPVHKATYDAYYEEIIKKEGVPFVPHAIGKDLIFAALVMIAILACAAIFGPAGPSGPPDPTRVDTYAAPGFLFPLDLCHVRAAAGLDGDHCPVLRARPAAGVSVRAAVSFREPARRAIRSGRLRC